MTVYDLFVGAFFASFEFLAIIAGVIAAVAVSGLALWAVGYAWFRLFCWSNKDDSPKFRTARK